MKTELICASIIFSVMVFTPCLSGLPKKPEPVALTEEIIYEEPSVSVLNVYDGSVFTLPMEEYLLGVVLAEMPASFQDEALKAQSVAARTYTQKKLSSPTHENADICMAASCCQAYIFPDLYEGDDVSLAKVKKAVDETRGEIMTYKDEPVLAVFHSMSAGKTEDAENVWGSSVPYLKSAESFGEEEVDRFESTLTISFTEFKSKLNSMGASVNSPSDIGKAELTDAGYVKSITIGAHSFKGSEIRSLFSLRSSAFTISADEELVTFSVKGYGHGVGMSQHGANILAKEGKTYDEILKHYYNGVEIETIK